MARRGLSSEELTKKRKKLSKTLVERRNKVKFEQNRKNKGSGDTTTTTTKKLTGVERAKAAAKKNIKKYGSTAKAAAANKEAMRLKIKKKYLASKKKK